MTEEPITPEVTGGEYPEGFFDWNQKLMELMLEGMDKFNPELILGALETVKVIYLEMAYDKHKVGGGNNG